MKKQLLKFLQQAFKKVRPCSSYVVLYVLQCIITMYYYNVFLQCIITMYYYNVLLQCMTDINTH